MGWRPLSSFTVFSQASAPASPPYHPQNGQAAPRSPVPPSCTVPPSPQSPVPHPRPAARATWPPQRQHPVPLHHRWNRAPLPALTYNLRHLQRTGAPDILPTFLGPGHCFCKGWGLSCKAACFWKNNLIGCRQWRWLLATVVVTDKENCLT